jgi:hypothetical protein
MKTLQKANASLYQQAALGYRRLTGKKRTTTTLFIMLAQVDPTPKGHYMRWLCERLIDDSFRKDAGASDLDKGKESRAYRTLMAFHLSKGKLPEDQRNILNYYSLHEIEQIIGKIDRQRDTCHRGFMASMDAISVYHTTLIEKSSEITIHAPRNIEEAALLIQNESLLDARGQGLYRDLLADGDIRIFMSSGHTLIGAVTPQGSRSIVFDSMGEHAVFEDMLSEVSSLVDLDWSTHQNILQEMVRIDPTLPFDLEMGDAQAYQQAILQFPHVLLEDREIPDHLREEILKDETVRGLVAEYER